ncbi:MAG: hypothetical protein IT372_15775 [Polyangiaceae bacterium]|nr:hypothetical protein [Polyangiaceae bacterium]
MGVDFIGWRDCPLQHELGPEGFLGKLKLRAYKRMFEEHVPEGQRAEAEAVVHVSGRPDRKVRYGEICAEVAAFEQGIPECATCPLAGGRQLGCYRYVTYPVDALAERLIFEFLVEGLSTPDSIADRFIRYMVSHDDEETEWHEDRGEDGGLAELPEPLVHTWVEGGVKRRVDSAQVMAAMFPPLDEPAVVVAYTRFWHELFQFIRGRIEKKGVKATGDGLELHAASGEHPEPEQIAESAAASIALAKEIAESGTLRELEDVFAMLASSLKGVMEDGWTVLVDA